MGIGHRRFASGDPESALYFTGLHTPELKLKFEQGSYGPYSGQVRHLVQEMEAVYLTGFGDGTAPVQRLDPIEPTASGRLRRT